MLKMTLSAGALVCLALVAPAQASWMVFGLYSTGTGRRLWLDNLTITDSDTPIPEPGTLLVVGSGA
jgi:hypothetical protein